MTSDILSSSIFIRLFILQTGTRQGKRGVEKLAEEATKFGGRSDRQFQKQANNFLKNVSWGSSFQDPYVSPCIELGC